jgi:hypothetical protein
VLLSRVYVMKFEVCQDCFMLLFPVYVMHKQGTITQNTADTPQTSLHKHDIPQSSLHKHGTKTHITPYIPQAPLHEHGTA